VVESPFVARFINPLSTPPDSLVLSVRPLETEDKLPEEPGGLYWWRPNSEDQITKHLTLPHEVELSLEPGLYLLNYFAEWQEFGDVSYGFLVEVPPTQGSESAEEELEVSVVVVLAEAGLNIRSEPGLSSEVIGYLPAMNWSTRLVKSRAATGGKLFAQKMSMESAGFPLTRD
jgi:hypothetical protein